jgi:cyclin L
VLERSSSRLSQTASEASIYLAAKLSFTPVSPRSVCNVYAYLFSECSSLPFVRSKSQPTDADPSSYYVSEGSYERERDRIFGCESVILSILGFDTQVTLPHTLALTYLQALGVSSQPVATRVIEHLNGGLLSPQLLYITHQPNSLAVAAIYLAAREVGVKLVDGNWWEVFDVEREDLGFVVLAFGSFEGFAEVENVKWSKEEDDMGKLLAGF